MFSVSYCVFDTKVGNNIDYTYPEDVELKKEVSVKALEDFCFPDGGHDSFRDTVAVALPRRRKTETEDEGNPGKDAQQEPPSSSGPEEKAPPATAIVESPPPDPSGPTMVLTAEEGEEKGGEADQEAAKETLGAGSPSGAANNESLSASPITVGSTGSPITGFQDSEENLIFGLAAYHLRKDTTVHRGAIQRSMLILTTVPCHQVCQDVADRIIFPFFDKVENDDGESPRVLARRIFEALEAALPCCPRTDCFADAGGSFANTSISSLAATYSPKTAPEEQSTKEKEKGRAQTQTTVRVVSPRTPGSGLSGLSTPRSPAASPLLPRNCAAASTPLEVVVDTPLLNPPLVSVDSVGPFSRASLRAQLAHGASVKKLIVKFPQMIGMLHWCLLCRTPLLFIGKTADEVGEAVRASILLLRPLPMPASAFLPYATIELLHELAAPGTNATPKYLVVGATNAFVLHRDLPGFVKCNLETGEVSFAEGAEKRTPTTKHSHEFEDLVAASGDPQVRECYFRARLEKLNRVIQYQLCSLKDGSYYHCLCRVSNIIDVPIGSEEALEANTNPSNDSFLVVKGQPSEAPPAAAQPPTDNDGGSASPETNESASPQEAKKEGLDTPLINKPPPVPPPASSASSPAGSPKSTTSQSPAALPTDRRYRSLVKAIDAFENSANENIEVPLGLQKWFRFVFRYLVVTLIPHSSHNLVELFESFTEFKIPTTKGKDDSLLFCPSDAVAALKTQLKIDRGARLGVGRQYKEMAWMLFDAVSKNNTSALLRPRNRKFSDLFHVDNLRLYNFPQQVLLFHSSCKSTMHHDSIWGVSDNNHSGHVYLSRHYIAFDYGSSRLSKEHKRQVFPFDVATDVSRLSGPKKGTRVTLALPPVVSEGVTPPLPPPSTLTWEITDMGDQSTTFFEICRTLWQRQRFWAQSLKRIPPLHRIPQPPTDSSGATAGNFGSSSGDTKASLSLPPTFPGALCPIVLPAGLYTRPREEFFEEVWENERHYPIVGWSKKLLPGDPSHFSDFSGTYSRPREQVTLPPGFKWNSDWKLACELDVLTSDRCMLELEDEAKYLDVEATAAQRIEATSPRRKRSATTTTDATKKGTAQDEENYAWMKDDFTEVHSENINTTDGWIYASSWTSDAFKAKNEVGTTVRRRLWVRSRGLLPPLRAPAGDAGAVSDDDETLQALAAQYTTAFMHQARRGAEESSSGRSGSPADIFDEDDDLKVDAEEASELEQLEKQISS